MSLYENNLQAFAQLYPLTAAKLLQISENNRFEVFQDPSDPLNVNIVDHQFDTIFYPDIPQQTILNQLDTFEDEFSRYPVLFVYGVANGLFIKLLLQNQNHQFIIVIEPELELLFIAFNLIDFTKEIQERRVHFFLDEQMDFVRASGIFSDAQIKVFSKTYHLEPNSLYYENHYSASLLRINSIMTRAIEHVVTGLGNDSIDALTGLEWHLANLPKMVETPTLVELISKIKTTQTAVIVSTGPSLAKQITFLSQIKEHVTILSVDASLPILEKNNIKPDIVCSIERVPITAHFYRETSPEFLHGIISVVSSISHPVLVESVSETTMQMNTRPFGYTRYFDLSDYGYVGIGMSAANLAYEVAFHARFKNIILIGQDLAFGEDGQSHSDGHVLHNIKYKDSDSYVIAYGGNGTVRTSMLWNMFRNFYETDIQSANETGIVTINATEGGARIHGALELPFKDAIEHYVDQSISKHSILLETPSDELIETRKRAVEDKMVKMSEYVTLMQRTVSTLFEKVAACTEYLDRIHAKKNLSKVDYDELAGLMSEIDEIKSKFDEPMFADIFIDATQALIVHQELELARIQVRPVQSDDDRRLKMIDWIYAHKTWLFSLAGIMEAERIVIERRGSNAYILRDFEIIANRVTGYIFDLKDSSKIFDVKLIIDGEIVDETEADRPLYHYLIEGNGIGRFNFEIPERFFDNQVHTIYVKEKDLGLHLSYNVNPVVLLEAMKTYGQVFEKSKVSYSGWCKKVNSEETQKIDIYIDDQMVDTIISNKNIDNYEYIFSKNSFCFEYFIPEKYFDDKEHCIEFNVNDTLTLENGKFYFTGGNSEKGLVYEHQFYNSLYTNVSYSGFEKYHKQVIGFVITESNSIDKDFINYVQKLNDVFDKFNFIGFYFSENDKKVAELLFKNERFEFVCLKTVKDIIDQCNVFIVTDDLMDLYFYLVLNNPFIFCRHFRKNMFGTDIEMTIKIFDKNYDKTYFLFNNKDCFGIQDKDILDAEYSVSKLPYIYALNSIGVHKDISNDQNIYEFIYFESIRLMDEYPKALKFYNELLAKIFKFHKMINPKIKDNI